MPVPVPEEWSADPPEMLVVGEGAYARALTQVLGAVRVAPGDILSGVQPADSGVSPRVLNDLKRVFLVVHTSDSAADVLRVHAAVWEWVKQLSKEKEHLRLAIEFVLPHDAAPLREALAAGLSLKKLDLEAGGHGACEMAAGLSALMQSAARIKPADWVALEGRRRADSRTTVLNALKEAASRGDANDIREAVAAVQSAFRGQEYHLDLFCRSPSHPNGNRLRSLLDGIVTGGVTPSVSEKTLAKTLAELLQ